MTFPSDAICSACGAVLSEEASRATVGRVANLVSKATGRDFVTRRTPTGVKVWRLA